MFSGSTDTSIHYNASKIKSLLNKGRFKNYFSENNTYKDRSRSRSTSFSKTREAHRSISVSPEKIIDINKEDSMTTNVVKQDTKKKGLSLPWSNYAAFMGLTNTKNQKAKDVYETPESGDTRASKTSIKSKGSQMSLKSIESKKESDGDKWQIKKSVIIDTKKHKTRRKSKTKSPKARRASITSIGSATDLIKKFSSSKKSPRRDKERKRRKVKYLKSSDEKQIEDDKKTSVTSIKDEVSNKSLKITTILKRSSMSSRSHKARLSSSSSLIKTDEQYSSRSLKKSLGGSHISIKESLPKVLYKAPEKFRKQKSSKGTIKKFSNTSVKKKISKSNKPVTNSNTATAPTKLNSPKKTASKDKSKQKPKKSPTRSVASQNKGKELPISPASKTSVIALENECEVLKGTALPTKKSISKKRCKGECIGKGRIVYTEKENEHVEEPNLSANGRKHMSIFNLDKYMMLDRYGESSSEMLRTKASKKVFDVENALGSTIFETTILSKELLIENLNSELKTSPISDDKLARQKLSAHKNEKTNQESWSKIEVESQETANSLKSKDSNLGDNSPSSKTSFDETCVNIINCDDCKCVDLEAPKLKKSESFYINSTITELMTKINVMKELLPDELKSRTIQQKNIDSIIRTIEMLKEVLQQKTNGENSELAEFGKANSHTSNNTDIKLEKLLNMSDDYITNTIQERELICFLNESKSLCDSHFAETKNDEVQTEKKALKNTAIQYKPSALQTFQDSHNIKNVIMSEVFDKTAKKPKKKDITVHSGDEKKKGFENVSQTRKSRVNLLKEDCGEVQTHMSIYEAKQKLYQLKSRPSKKKPHRRKAFVTLQREISENHVPLQSNSCQGGFKCDSVENLDEIYESLQSQKRNLISFDKCRSTSSNNFIIRHITKSQQFDKQIGDDDIIPILKKEMSEDSLKRSSASLINSGVRCETIYDTEMTEDSLIYDSSKKTRKVRNKRRCIVKNAGTATDSDDNLLLTKMNHFDVSYHFQNTQETSRFCENIQSANVLKQQASNCTILFENFESMSALETPTSTVIDENSTTKSKKSEDSIYSIKQKIENGENAKEAEKISENEEEDYEEGVSANMRDCEEKGKYEAQDRTNPDDLLSSEDLTSSKLEADFENVEIKDKFSFTQANAANLSELLQQCENKEFLIDLEDATKYRSNCSIQSDDTPKQCESTATLSEIAIENTNNQLYVMKVPEDVDKNNAWCTSFENEFGLQMPNSKPEELTDKDNENVKKNGVYYFPSITIYNRNYVNSIGEWMKNSINDNSSDEKLPNLQDSIENGIKTNGSCSNVSHISSIYNHVTYNNIISENVDNHVVDPVDRNSLTIRRTNSERFKKTFRIDSDKAKEKEMNFINISVDCNNYACQKIINNFKFGENNNEDDKESKKRESRIPVLIPTMTKKHRKTFWKEFNGMELKKNKICAVSSREFYIPKCPTKMQSVQTNGNNMIPQQSDMSTLVSLCSLENDSMSFTTEKKVQKEKRPKYHLISRAYCTVADCINVGQNKLQTLPIKTESYTIKSVHFNSKGLIATKCNKTSDTSSSSTFQTNTSCIERIQALMSSMNNKKSEKSKKGRWKNFMLSLKKKENYCRDFEESKKSNAKNISFLKRPKHDQTLYYNQNNKDVNEHLQESNDVELLQGSKMLGVNKSMHASSYQTLFSKDTEITEVSSGIEVLYPANQMEEPHDSETFTICSPNSRFGLHSRPRSVESFFKPHKKLWRTKSACFDYNQFSEHYCATMKKTCSSNLLVKNQKLQECYHYCKCGQLLKIEIIKNLKC